MSKIGSNRRSTRSELRPRSGPLTVPVGIPFTQSNDSTVSLRTLAASIAPPLTATDPRTKTQSVVVENP